MSPQDPTGPEQPWALDLGSRDPVISTHLWPPDLAWPGGPREGFVVHLHWAQVEGRLEAVGVKVRTARREIPPGADPDSHPGEVVHGVRPFGVGDLRTVPLGRLIAEDRQRLIEQHRRLAVNLAGFDQAPVAMIADTEQAFSRRQHRYPEDHYQQVAHLYDEACRFGSPHPTAYVAAELKMPRSTAAHHVVQARRMGLLPATKPRQARGNIKTEET